MFFKVPNIFEKYFFGYLDSLFLLCVKLFKMMAETLLSVPEQVSSALDGRTQRWLALQASIPESDLSKKMKGKMEFTDEEINSINSLLKVEIKK